MVGRAGILAGALLVTGACAGPGASPQPSMRLIDDPREEGFATLVVEGLPADALRRFRDLPEHDARREELLRVYTGGGPPPADQPPVFGRVGVEGELLRFRPRFPLVAGLEHFARFRGSLVGVSDHELVFALPPAAEPSTHVITTYPDVEEVPSNLLRTYVCFSAPMHARDVMRHVHLVDDEGRELEGVFVDVPDGLWDPGGRRLTLFFHPGRIKRGVGPNEALGPPLEPGRSYRLVIDAELEDAHGARLSRPHVWSFRTGAADRAAPDPSSWELHPPEQAGAPVELLFGESLDHALVERLVRVEDSAGMPLVGEAEVLDGGTRWSWQPAGAWPSGELAVVVDPSLEDLAGNALDHHFEERLRDDPGTSPAEASRRPALRLTFRASRR